MYKINELSKLAGVSTRTLRYYDNIGLLSPSQIADNNYRLYTEKEIDLLQQILFYKELGFSLTEIKDIVNNDDFDFLDALNFHKEKLTLKQERLNKLLNTINQTIRKEKKEIKMTNEEKFKNLKEDMIKENETKYGFEIREKYGDTVINQSNEKMRKMSKWQMNEAKRLGEDINVKLAIALKTNNPSSIDATEVCQMHQTWIKLYWPTYSIEAHLGLVDMYTKDERFKAYYEKVGEGATEFLKEAMNIYLKKDH